MDGLCVYCMDNDTRVYYSTKPTVMYSIQIELLIAIMPSNVTQMVSF